MKVKYIAVLLSFVLTALFGTAVAADDPQPYLNSNVTVDASEGVDVTLTKVRVANNITVRFEIKPQGDYLVRGIEIKDSQGKPVSFDVIDQYIYTFELPKQDVTIHVAAEDYGDVTRAECAEAFWKIAGCPVVDFIMLYDDVASDSDYTEAIRWATAEKIMTGTDEDSFSPDALLTREELADIIYKYAGTIGIADSLKTDYVIETIDHEFISDFAYDGVCFAVGCGVMQAENRTAGYFNPHGEIFRYELEDILDKFEALIDNSTLSENSN